MHDLVFIQNEQALTTSLKIAETFGKEHKNVIRDIEEIVRKMTVEFALDKESSNLRIPNVYEMFIKGDYAVEGQLRKYPMYYLNRDGFTLLVMGFTGTKALQFKLAYIAAFNEMESTIQKLLLERQSAEWFDARTATKLKHKALTDVIQKKLIPLALEQGIEPKKAQMFYNNYNRMVNKIAGVKSKGRDALPLGQLYEVEKMLNMAAILVEDFCAKGTDHHKIYSDTKKALENYAQISLIEKRFITGI